jgi:hypothetical protein
VVRSARGVVLSGIALAALAGCATTQQKAAWLRVNDSRVRATQLSVRVLSPGSEVAVEQVAAVTGAGRTAIVVRLHNLAARSLSDLPISVGTIGASGKRTYLNSAPGLDFFRTHLPLVPAHGLLTWVYIASKPLAGAAHLFAEVGPQSLHARSPLPQIQVRPALRGSTHAGVVRLTVINRSSVPQYQLPVYAVVRRGGRYVAAGEGTIDSLAGGGSSAVRLTLVGRAGGQIQFEAPPTIFE